MRPCSFLVSVNGCRGDDNDQAYLMFQLTHRRAQKLAKRLSGVAETASIFVRLDLQRDPHTAHARQHGWNTHQLQGPDHSRSLGARVRSNGGGFGCQVDEREQWCSFENGLDSSFLVVSNCFIQLCSATLTIRCRTVGCFCAIALACEKMFF